jgi:hypothetical protein
MTTMRASRAYGEVYVTYSFIGTLSREIGPCFPEEPSAALSPRKAYPIDVRDDVAGVGLLDGPGRREAAGRHPTVRDRSASDLL